MENRNIKEISKNIYSLFIGIFLCLISISLGLNAGYVAKAISFPFVYLFGIFCYVFYALIFVNGLCLIIKKTTISLKFSKYLVFGFFASLGLLALLTYIIVNQESAYLSFVTEEGSVSFFKQFNLQFGNIKYSDGMHNYFVKEPANVFAGSEFGCGLAGYALLALGNSIFSSKIGGLILSLVLLVGSGVALVIPFILKITSSLGKNKKESAQNVGTKNRIKNINVIKDAKNVDPMTYHSEVSGAGKNMEEFYSEPQSIENSENMPLKDPSFIENSIETEIHEEIPEAEQLDVFSAAVFDDNSDLKNDIKEENNLNSSLNEALSIDEHCSLEQKDEEVQFFQCEDKEEKQLDIIEENSLSNSINQEIFVESKPEIIQPKEETVVVEEKKEEPVKKRERVEWSPISEEILKDYETSYALEINARTAEERKNIINNAFVDFGVGAEVVDYTIGPSITRFNIRYNSNVSSRSVANMIQDISIRLNGTSARFESVIEGQSTSGLEIPNAEITTVGFKDVFKALPDNLKKHPLAVAFGKNIKGDVIFADYDEFPHMLISGTTGSGKSVFVNSIICTLIMRNSPDDLKLVLVDPKKVEMSRYADMPHLLTPIITEPSKVKLVLDKLVEEMEKRYSLFSANNATNIKEYNEDCLENGNERMPYIVVVLDEYADLVEQCKEISFPVVMLAQKARACGIHLMLSTQRPSTNVVTGVIKANMPTHVALMCASSVDSIVIIGEGGAEKLLGKGDMLVQSPLVSRVGVCRLQSCFIDRKEIIGIVSELKNKYETVYDEKYLNLEEKKTVDDGSANFQDSGDGDEESKYQSIKSWVMTQEFMSMSKIQRDCAVGFNRAGRFFARLQKEGVVALEAESNKGCRVIVQDKFDDDYDSSFTSEDNSYIK